MIFLFPPMPAPIPYYGWEQPALFSFHGNGVFRRVRLGGYRYWASIR